MIPVIIDTDIGTDVDDALAIALAVRSPEVEILGITTVSGDARYRAVIAVDLLHALGHPDIPVSAGLDAALDGKNRSERIVEKVEPSVIEDRVGVIDKLPAVDFIIQTLSSHPEKVTIVTLGPLTNFAAALRKEPEIKDRIKAVFAMGGTVFPGRIFKDEGWLKLPGFVKAFFEYNFNTDPDAAVQVLSSGLDLTVVPAEVTFKTWLKEDEYRRMEESRESYAPVLTDMCGRWIDTFKEILNRHRVPEIIAKVYLHDPLALTAIFDPTFITIESMKLHVYKRFTRVHIRRRSGVSGDLKVAVAVNAHRFKRFFLERVFG